MNRNKSITEGEWRALQPFLTNMSEARRAMVKAYLVDGKTYADVAAQYGRAASSVHAAVAGVWKLHKARLLSVQLDKPPK